MTDLSRPSLVLILWFHRANGSEQRRLREIWWTTHTHKHTSHTFTNTQHKPSTTNIPILTDIYMSDNQQYLSHTQTQARTHTHSHTYWMPTSASHQCLHLIAEMNLFKLWTFEDTKYYSVISNRHFFFTVTVYILFCLQWLTHIFKYYNHLYKTPHTVFLPTVTSAQKTHWYQK